MTNLKIAIGQTKCITGNLTGNAHDILEDIRKAKDANADLIVFPELAISGYCCGALYNMEQFVSDQLTILNEVIGVGSFGINVVIGAFINPRRDKAGFPVLYNSAILFRKDKGTELGIYTKRLLANGDHHEDLKYFQPGNKNGVFEIETQKGKKVKLGILICEDAWNTQHTEDLVKNTVKDGAEVIVTLNQSYFYYGKQQKRYELFSNHAKNNKVPVIAVNSVGVGDIVKNIIIFDGGSMAFNNKGEMIAECKRFEEDFKVFDLNAKPKKFKTPNKYDEIFQALVFEQKELFRVVKIPKAQVHLSGGIDSALVATVVYEAMGKNNTLFITNPSLENSKKIFNQVKKLCKNLKTDCLVQNISGTIDEAERILKIANNLIKPDFNKPHNEVSKLVESTVHAVERSVFGLASANQYGTGIVATGNHTEIVEGWANFHDIGSIGVHSIIGDLTKVEVFQFAKWINEKIYKKEIIPHELYDGTIKPAAELVDASEDPFDYFVRSGIDAEMIRNRKSPDQLIKDFKEHTLTPDFFPKGWDGKDVYKLSLNQFIVEVELAFNNSKKSVFKAAQAAPIVIISPRSRGFSNRETIINWYRPL